MSDVGEIKNFRQHVITVSSCHHYVITDFKNTCNSLY